MKLNIHRIIHQIICIFETKQISLSENKFKEFVIQN